MMMGFKIALHKQRGGARTYFPQQSMFHEKPQIVVHGS
jgi:hypothetical protein